MRVEVKDLMIYFSDYDKNNFMLESQRSMLIGNNACKVCDG